VRRQHEKNRPTRQRGDFSACLGAVPAAPDAASRSLRVPDLRGQVRSACQSVESHWGQWRSRARSREARSDERCMSPVPRRRGRDQVADEAPVVVISDLGESASWWILLGPVAREGTGDLVKHEHAGRATHHGRVGRIRTRVPAPLPGPGPWSGPGVAPLTAQGPARGADGRSTEGRHHASSAKADSAASPRGRHHPQDPATPGPDSADNVTTSGGVEGRSAEGRHHALVGRRPTPAHAKAWPS